MPKLADREWQFSRYANALGCSDGVSDTMSCLRGLTIEQLQSVNTASPFPNATENPIFYWAPTVDGVFIEDYPSNLFSSGKYVFAIQTTNVHILIRFQDSSPSQS